MLSKRGAIGLGGLNVCETLKVLEARLSAVELEAEAAFQAWVAGRGTEDEISLWHRWQDAKRAADDAVQDLN